MPDYQARICPVCNGPIYPADETEICQKCGSISHKACWMNNRGCATHGCPNNTKERAPAPQPAPAYQPAPPAPQPAPVYQPAPPAPQPAPAYQPAPPAPQPAPAYQPAPPAPQPASAYQPAPPAPAPQPDPSPIICEGCGVMLSPEAEFCTNCGRKTPPKTDTSALNPAFSQGVAAYNRQLEQKKKKKWIIPVAVGGGAALIAIIVAVVILLTLPKVESIRLGEDDVSVKPDGTTSVSYVIYPEEASNAKVQWVSSDPSVASVSSDGVITGVGEGTCTVTAKAGGKTDSVTVTVRSGPDFSEIFSKCECESSFATVGSDGSYLFIDTNPNDSEDYTDYSALYAIILVNEELGLPDSVFNDMTTTRAIDGTQKRTFDEVTVSWSFHPDRGLEVTYESN